MTDSAIPPIRLQHFARRINALGPRPLYELLRELIGGACPLERIEAYAALDADLVHALGAAEFPAPLIVAGYELEEVDDVA